MLDLFREGGLIMYPLLLCSIIIWAIALEKWIFIRQLKKETSILYDKSKGLFEEKKFHEAKGLSHSVHPLLASPFCALLEREDLSEKNWEEKILRKFSETQMGMKKNLWALGTISSSAPFIGLFGTIAGIMQSFDDIAIAGKGGFAVVAAGLSEALIATAAGILVAVMAVILYNFFLSRLQIFNLEFKNKIFDLKDFL